MVIERIVERGSPSEWEEMIGFYGAKKVKHTLKKDINYLSDRAIKKVTNYFNLKLHYYSIKNWRVLLILWNTNFRLLFSLDWKFFRNRRLHPVMMCLWLNRDGLILPKHPLLINILISINPSVIPFITLINSMWDKMNIENNS